MWHTDITRAHLGWTAVSPRSVNLVPCHALCEWQNSTVNSVFLYQLSDLTIAALCLCENKFCRLYLGVLKSKLCYWRFDCPKQNMSQKNLTMWSLYTVYSCLCILAISRMVASMDNMESDKSKPKSYQEGVDNNIAALNDEICQRIHVIL